MDPHFSRPVEDDEDDDGAPVVRGRGRGSRAGKASRTPQGADSMGSAASEQQGGSFALSSESSYSASGVTETMSGLGSLNLGTSMAGSELGGSRASMAGGSVRTGSGYSRNTGGSTVTRPENWNKKGKDGKIVELITNYFEVSKQCFQPLYQFRVDFDPEEDMTQTKKNLMKNLPTLGKFIFDGQVMYKTADIAPENLEHEVLGENNARFKIKIRFVGLVMPTDNVYLQFYNIMLRKCMSLLNLEELGRNFYDRHKKIAIPEGKMELWPGYATAIRHHEHGLFLCAEITHKVLRTSSVMDELNDFYNKFRENPRKNELIKEQLVGQIVMSKYNRKTYKIDDIDFEASPQSPLGGEADAGTYAEYFLRKYNQQISDMNQPMLVSNPRKRDQNKGITNKIYLVPSLCNMTGLSDEMRKNFQVMKRVSEHLHVNPTERKKKLDAFMESLRTNPEVQKEFQSWNIDFNPTFVKVDARYLGMEKIVVSGGAEILPDFLGDWSSGLRGHKLASCKSIDRWILFAPESERPNLPKFIDGVRRQAQVLGMAVQQPMEIAYYEARRPANEREMNFIMEKEKNQDCQMVFFVLPNNQLQRYTAVKKFFILEWKVPLQCFLSKNIGHKSFNSICSKLMIQVNAKLGGEPWHIKVPLKQVMILGFDVYHCSQRKNQSVGALVATISPNLARYFSTVSFHKDKSELSSNMCLDTKKCLEAYRKANGELPNRIVMYRDGVGEGQVNFVLEHEIAHIRAAIEDMYKDRDAALFSFIIVTKKINTRVMVHDLGTGSMTNPAPGTVVDDVITLPERYDFFLVSQSVRQGTVSPTNYNVIYDTSGMPPDRMQRLTYKMCHLYFNWSGTVAVPAPCQYAHKLAYLTGVALNDQAPVDLADVLWFL